jgi:hypothetical protein
MQQIWFAVAFGSLQNNVYLKGKKDFGISKRSENVVAALELIPTEKFPNISSIGSKFRLSE